MKLDTTNSHGVTAHQGRVIAVLPVGKSWTPEDAVRFAAWLIVAADLCLIPKDERHEIGGEVLDPLQDAIDTVNALRGT